MARVITENKPCFFSKPRFIRVPIAGTFPKEYRLLPKNHKDAEGEPIDRCDAEGVVSVCVDGQTRWSCLDHTSLVREA